MQDADRYLELYGHGAVYRNLLIKMLKTSEKKSKLALKGSDSGLFFGLRILCRLQLPFGLRHFMYAAAKTPAELKRSRMIQKLSGV